MGLDITAYEIVEPYDGDTTNRDALCDRDDLVHVYTIAGFEARLPPLRKGWYRVSGKTVRFKAGSYGGYNAWREDLCQMALGVTPDGVWEHPETFSGQPFYELINFADNEGVIGTDAAAKLAVDFDTWDARAFARWCEGGSHLDQYSYDRYQNWRAAFRLAAERGCVEFH